MKRIWVTGSSGSGKTTLANLVGAKLDIPVYHNDKIFWDKGWKVRALDQQMCMTKEITEQEKWIYEGNRFNYCKEDGRYNECDTIIYLDLNRFICVYRFIKRYFRYRGKIRPDITDGCIEKIDFDIIKYILYDYPKKKSSRLELIKNALDEGKNIIILKSAKDIERWVETI